MIIVVRIIVIMIMTMVTIKCPMYPIYPILPFGRQKTIYPSLSIHLSRVVKPKSALNHP